MAPRPVEAYVVGVVCALPKEMTAARAMLDEEHEPLKSQDAQDSNSYVLGQVYQHNVVIACLPAGVYGTNATATVAMNMLRTFTGIRFSLLVGIGGGIPDLAKGIDIRLGDVVVSQPDQTYGGVVQYDLGKKLGKGSFERKGSLNKPPPALLTALSVIQSKSGTYTRRVSDNVSAMIQKPDLADQGYAFPGVDRDYLFCARCDQSQWRLWSCNKCDNGKISRPPNRTGPKLHCGIIASGNALIKNAAERDRLRNEFGAKCVEMEAAGLMDEFPCIVIRGICDYADSHKNDVWQKYAAVTAAAFAKELLSVVSPIVVGATKHTAEAMKYDLGLNLFDAPEINDNLFVSRETEIQRIEKILQPVHDARGLTRKVLSLGGMGGIGKTQLAIMYAKRFRSCYSSIFWLNAKDEAALQSSLYSLAKRVIAPEAVSKLERAQLWIHVSNWLSELDNNRWLLIFDNYDDPDQYHITKYYPSVAHGSIIITTRQPLRVNGEHVFLESLKSIEDGLQILATRSGREGTKSDLGARQLAQRLDGHPLALATAGAFLKQSSVSFAEYLQQYEEKWQVIDAMDELPDYPTRTLHTTWNLSFAQIERENMRAACLLKFFAYIDNQDIWYGLLSGASKEGNCPLWFLDVVRDKFAFEEVIRVLTKFCLVDAHYQTGSYSLHVCVHDWTLNGLNREFDLDLYRLALDCIACHIMGDWDNLSSQTYSQFTPHASRLAHNRFIKSLELEHLFQKESFKVAYIAELLYKKGQFTATESIQQRLLASKEKALSAEDTSTLDTVNNLGLLYWVQGKLVEAEQMFQRALQGTEKALGAEHTSTLNIVNNLGILYKDQGKLAEAEQMFQRALQGTEKALGAEHTSTLNTVNNLGILYKDQGKLAEAEQMFQRALQGKEKALGAEHTSTLNTVYNLGILYRHQGRLAEAEQMFQRALQGYEKAFSAEHTSTLDILNNLGLLYIDQGKLAEAEQMFQRALQGYEKAFSAEHTSTLDILNNLGLLYIDQGKLAEAEQMFQRALQGYEKAFSVEHTSTLDILNNLGILYNHQGKLAEAEQMYQRALQGYEKAFSAEHTSTLDILNNLGILYMYQGKLAEAEQMYQRALQGYEKALSAEHMSTLGTVNNLGVLYMNQGKLAEAKQMYQRALQGYEKAIGPDYPKSLDLRNKLRVLDNMVDQGPNGRERASG